MLAYLSWGFNATLFVLGCFLAANTGTALIGSALTPPPEEVVVAAAPPAPTRSWNDRQVILDRNLFNASTLAPPPVLAAPSEDLEKTKLPLTLLGTAASPDPRYAWAAVEDRDKRETLVVGVGDTLKERATVVRIERRRLVLNENGNPRELTLDEEPGAPSVRRSARPSRTARAARRPRSTRTARERNTASPPELNARLEKLGENRFSVPKSDVAEAIRNPASLFSQARILPKYEGGEMVGVQLNAIKSQSLFSEMGIEDGDVITEMNGIAIDSPEQSAKLLQEFAEADDFDVTLIGADGASRTINFKLEQ
jgi:general secretion pathway protein C